MRRRLARSVTRAIVAQVANSSDERLERRMRGLRRRVVLATVFRAMAARLDRSEAAGLDAVIEVRIRGEGKVEDRWQLQIERGTPTAVRAGAAEPTLVLTMRTATFLRLVTGTSQVPALYLRGKIRVEGDVLSAIDLPGLFRVPRLR
jgi:putative sterol carrier protein